MSLYKVSNFYVTRQPPQREVQFSQNHCNIAKQKIKTALKRSKEKSKQNFQNALKQSTSNVPLASIDLAQKINRKSSIISLQKCKSQLSLQKQLLLKELETKQQKLQTLRQTFRNIQSSRPKLVLKKDEKQEKGRHTKRNTDMTSLTSGQQNRSKPKHSQNLRQRPMNSKELLGVMQRTRLFPMNIRPFE